MDACVTARLFLGFSYLKGKRIPLWWDFAICPSVDLSVYSGFLSKHLWFWLERIISAGHRPSPYRTTTNGPDPFTDFLQTDLSSVHRLIGWKVSSHDLPRWLWLWRAKRGEAGASGPPSHRTSVFNREPVLGFTWTPAATELFSPCYQNMY